MLTPLKSYYLLRAEDKGELFSNTGCEVQSEDIGQGLLIDKGTMSRNPSLETGMHLVYKDIETIDVSIEGDMYVLVLEEHICAVAASSPSIEDLNRNDIHAAAV